MIKTKNSMIIILRYFFILLFLMPLTACPKTNAPAKPGIEEVGFDIDDTLLFSSPAFDKAFEDAEKPFSREFWEIVNSSDKEKSIVKKKTLSILKEYQRKGASVFLITARKNHGGEQLRAYMSELLNIPSSHIFFESDGKTARIKDLGIDVFFGDSDSDIQDALSAGAEAYRIIRSTASSYKKKYNPGRYGEKIIEGSAW